MTLVRACWPPVFREAYCVFNMLRTLGFDSEDLYLEADDRHVAMTLHLGGDMSEAKMYRVVCGRLEMPHDTLMQLWKEFIEELQAVPQEELNAFAKSAKANRYKVELVSGLVTKGLYSKEGATSRDRRSDGP